jgi:hypothetical protein
MELFLYIRSLTPRQADGNALAVRFMKLMTILHDLPTSMPWFNNRPLEIVQGCANADPAVMKYSQK